MPMIGGLNYTYRELCRMSGLCKSSLRGRMKSNPNITIEQLIAPPKDTRHIKRRVVVVDNVEVPLFEWADKNNVSRTSVDYRWRHGVRDPEELIQGISDTAEDCFLPPITTEMLEWLCETAYARKGMPDEWEIACELIGISKGHANKLKEYVEGEK